MKKIILALLLLITVNNIKAQTTVSTNKYIIGEWNTVTKDWDYDTEFNYSDIDFTYNNGMFTVNDVRHSVYYLNSDVITKDTKDMKSSSWLDVTDEKGRGCILSLCHYPKSGNKVIIIIYENIIIKYYIKKETKLGTYKY
jgi:hypothetical protein